MPADRLTSTSAADAAPARERAASTTPGCGTTPASPRRSRNRHG